MAERTLTISSAGKTFSVTGWKIGWVSGPGASWSTAVPTVKQFLTYVNGAPFQPAVAHGAAPAGRAASPSWPTSLQAKRDLLVRRAGRGRASTVVPARRAPTSWSPTPRRSATTTGWRSAWTCRELAGVVAVPVGSSTTTRRRPLARAVRRLQAAGSARGGRPAAGPTAPRLIGCLCAPARASRAQAPLSGPRIDDPPGRARSRTWSGRRPAQKAGVGTQASVGSRPQRPDDRLVVHSAGAGAGVEWSPATKVGACPVFSPLSPLSHP